MVNQEDRTQRHGGAPLEGVLTSIRQVISAAVTALTPSGETDAASTDDGQDAVDGSQHTASGNQVTQVADQGTSADDTLFRGASQHADPVQTPEERILVLLEEHGGQLDQRKIADLIEWSEATVSRSLSDLEETGEVTRYRFGRGKIVVLDGVVPDLENSRMGGDH